MNRARFVAALIAAVGVTITVTGAGSALWLYRHEPVPRHAHRALLPPASSAPFPQSAIGNPGPMHYVGVFEHDTASNYRPVTLFTSVAGRKPNLTVYYSGWGMPLPGPLCHRGRPGRGGRGGAHGALAPVAWPPSPPGTQTATCAGSPRRSAATAATSS